MTFPLAERILLTFGRGQGVAGPLGLLALLTGPFDTKTNAAIVMFDEYSSMGGLFHFAYGHWEAQVHGLREMYDDCNFEPTSVVFHHSLEFTKDQDTEFKKLKRLFPGAISARGLNPWTLVTKNEENVPPFNRPFLGCGTDSFVKAFSNRIHPDFATDLTSYAPGNLVARDPHHRTNTLPIPAIRVCGLADAYIPPHTTLVGSRLPDPPAEAPKSQRQRKATRRK